MNSGNYLILILLLYLLAIPCFGLQRPSHTLEEIVLRFNDWISIATKSNNLVAAINESNDGILVKTTSQLSGDELLFEIDSDFVINSDSIYKGPLREFIIELDQKYTYEDSTYFILHLLSESNNPQSKLRAFLDILPYDPLSLAYSYEMNKIELDEKLRKTVALRKIVEYNLYCNYKAEQIFNQIVSEYPKSLDPTVFSIENLRWAIFIYDFYTVLHDNRPHLIPMVSQIQFSADGEIGDIALSSKGTDLSFTLSVFIRGYSQILNGSTLFRSTKMKGEELLLRYGIVLPGNDKNDCMSISFTFEGNSEDKLSNERAKFFSKFFSFDSTHMKYIDECLGVNNPFPQRLLFFFFTQMLSKSDLMKEEAKTQNLEEDIILMKYVSQNFVYLRESIEQQLSAYRELLSKGGINKIIRTAIQYRIQQYGLLEAISKLYNDHYAYLLREESL